MSWVRYGRGIAFGLVKGPNARGAQHVAPLQKNSEKDPRPSPGTFYLWGGQVRTGIQSCYHGSREMECEKQNSSDGPGELAKKISEALLRERIVPRFVDSYVIENGRQALQVHASLYRDLLALLQREALIALTMRTMEIVCKEPQQAGKSKPRPMPRREATLFRRKFLSALTKQQGWTAGEALDFQRDLHLYEELLARAGATRRSRKPFEAANHPFVDRCAFVLDSSFMEKARLAASQALAAIEQLAAAMTEQPRGGRVH